MFCALSPLSAGTLGAVFLHERLGARGLAGAALILCGIALPNLLAAAKPGWPAAPRATRPSERRGRRPERL